MFLAHLTCVAALVQQSNLNLCGLQSCFQICTFFLKKRLISIFWSVVYLKPLDPFICTLVVFLQSVHLVHSDVEPLLQRFDVLLTSSYIIHFILQDLYRSLLRFQQLLNISKARLQKQESQEGEEKQSPELHHWHH